MSDNKSRSINRLMMASRIETFELWAEYIQDIREDLPALNEALIFVLTSAYNQALDDVEEKLARGETSIYQCLESTRLPHPHINSWN